MNEKAVGPLGHRPVFTHVQPHHRGPVGCQRLYDPFPGPADRKEIGMAGCGTNAVSHGIGQILE
jgi:hypothetical protein